MTEIILEDAIRAWKDRPSMEAELSELRREVVVQQKELAELRRECERLKQELAKIADRDDLGLGDFDDQTGHWQDCEDCVAMQDIARKALEGGGLPHEASGAECTVSHMVMDDDPGGPCQICKYCHKKIRPQNMGDVCIARKALEGK